MTFHEMPFSKSPLSFLRPVHPLVKRWSLPVTRKTHSFIEFALCPILQVRLQYDYPFFLLLPFVLSHWQIYIAYLTWKNARMMNFSHRPWPDQTDALVILAWPGRFLPSFGVGCGMVDYDTLPFLAPNSLTG